MNIRVHGSRGSHPVATTPDRIVEIQKELFNMFQESKARTWDEFSKYLAELK